MLTRYQDVFDVSRDQERFSSYDEGFVIWDLEEQELALHRANFMGMRPVDHGAVKQVVLPAFSPKAMQVMVPEIDRLAREIVDEIAGRGECEFVFDVASKLLVYTFCELMGIPEALRAKVVAGLSTPSIRRSSSSRSPNSFQRRSGAIPTARC